MNGIGLLQVSQERIAGHQQAVPLYPVAIQQVVSRMGSQVIPSFFQGGDDGRESGIEIKPAGEKEGASDVLVRQRFGNKAPPVCKFIA